MMPSTAVNQLPRPPVSFEALYDAHAAFVWRTLARLGVASANVDDAAQEVFLVAHRQLPTFEGRSTPRTWLAGIAVRVASAARRAVQRRGDGLPLDPQYPDGRPSPHDAAARVEGLALLRRVLAAMPDEQQEVFVLMELEEHTAPEVAEAVGSNVNTVYSRLRLARVAFNEAVARLQEGQR